MTRVAVRTTSTRYEPWRDLADLRHRDPALVLARAREAGTREADAADRALAAWVEGVALHELGRPREAIRRYRRAASLATATGDDACEALARSSMAISLMSVGDARAAEAEIDAATVVSTPEVRGTVRMLRGLVLQRSGALRAALEEYARALRELRRAHDDAAVARLLLNRATLHAYRGELVPALSDLHACERLAAELDLGVLVAMAAHNTGFIEGRRGRVTSALTAFHRAREAYAALGDPARLVAVLESDRCELLLEAGLADDARDAAERAIEALHEVNDVSHMTEARLLLARACLAQADWSAADDEARAAAIAFRRSRRRSWAALADYVAIQAEVLATQDAAGAPPLRLLERTTRIADELSRLGWRVEGLHVRTYVGRIALALERRDEARAQLSDAARARHRGTASWRARAWHATALLRLADGNTRGARRALRRGIAVIDEHRAALGATELRAHAAEHGADLARLGIQLALRDGRATDVLSWAECWKAGALLLPHARLPDDHGITAELDELRRLHREVHDLTLRGQSTRKLDAQIARTESSIRSSTLRSHAASSSSRTRFDVAEVRAALTGRTLLEFVEFGGRLFVVCLDADRTRLRDVADAEEVVGARDFLLFALRRMLTPSKRAASVRAAHDAFRAAAGRLDSLLLQPVLQGRAGDVVVVPTGSLYGIPWGCLPSLRARATTVAPSAILWRRDRRGTRVATSSGVLLLAGPDLPGAVDEIDRLSIVYPRAQVLQGPAATTSATVDALQHCSLAHLAVHGTLRRDSPMFSSLRLADGPLTVYDLERLTSTPRTVILPACDAGVAAVHAGDELIGTATALLQLGVTTVVAPVLPVPDVAAAELMVGFHDGLRAGASPTQALASTAAGMSERDDPHDVVAAAAFVCIGCHEAG